MAAGAGAAADVSSTHLKNAPDVRRTCMAACVAQHDARKAYPGKAPQYFANDVDSDIPPCEE